MAHPQNSPRGLFAKGRINVGSTGVFFTNYSATTALLTANSTALKVAGGVQVSGKSTAKITGDSTGIVLAGAVKVGNKTTGVINVNTTALIVKALRINTLASYITSNSTGIKLGTRYISTNTTGNSAT